MQPMANAKPVPKVHWLVVDTEAHIDTVKELTGIDHHISADRFFEQLEQVYREFPLTPIKPKPPRSDDDDELPELITISLQMMRKRQALILDLPRLLAHWPGEWEGYPDLLVVSVYDAVHGYVGRVPEAFHFLADTVCIIRRERMCPIRSRDNSPFFDKVAEVFPMDSERIKP